MDIRLPSNGGRPQSEYVGEVVRSAENELKHLLRQRAEILKRIGTIKQTLSGLAKLFGESVLSPELLALVEGRTGRERQPGFTRACRIVLMEAAGPLKTREVCDVLREKFPDGLQRHSSPLASVATVLGRLESYSEVSSSLDPGGHRLWTWAAAKDGIGLPVEEERMLLQETRVG